MSDSIIDNIFLDKKKISLVILSKESALISSYSELINDLNSNYIIEERLGDSKYQYDNYNICWALAFEIYSFLRFNKIKQLKGEGLNEITTEEFNDIDRIMAVYESPRKDKAVNFKDLKRVYLILLKIVSYSGYHDDTYSKSVMDETPQFIEFDK